MNDPIFKSTDSPLSPEEELDITARFAAAYKDYDQSTDDTETQSIIRQVEEKLRQALSEHAPGSV
jgi:hypothetical protein